MIFRRLGVGWDFVVVMFCVFIEKRRDKLGKWRVVVVGVFG